MAVFSIVKLSELEGAKRMDAEYYRPEYLEIIDILTIKKAKPLIKLATDVICGPFGSSILERDYRPEGVPLIRVSDTADLFIKDDDLVFIDDSLSEKMKRYQVFPGDLVVSQRGTIAMFSLVTRKFSKWNISANLISIKKSNKINFNYLLIFLNSFYGASQLFRKQSGEVQPKITTDDVKQLLVFVANSDIQEKVSDLVELAYKEKEISYSLYSQAESLLLEELGLKDFKPKYEKTYTDKLSDAFSAHRIDAEYFQPAYEEVIKLLMKKVKVEKLKNVVSFISHGKQPYYVENGDIPVLIQKHLGSQLLSLYSEIVNMPDTPRTDREFVKKYPEYLIKPFDVLFYSVGAYLGRANVVLENFEAVPASFITLIRTKQEVCNPVYLALFLNSKIGQLQSSRWKSASAQQYIYPKEIKEFIIPILPLEIQQEIASLVQQSHEARKKAKELLELAKRAVEIAIEEGEEKAINFLSRIK